MLRRTLPLRQFVFNMESPRETGPKRRSGYRFHHVPHTFRVKFKFLSAHATKGKLTTVDLDCNGGSSALLSMFIPFLQNIMLLKAQADLLFFMVK